MLNLVFPGFEEFWQTLQMSVKTMSVKTMSVTDSVRGGQVKRVGT